jgi:hypothetical protein
VAIPRQLRWLVSTGLIVGALVLLGILAMDQKDVVWAGGKPHCPHCRSDTPMFSTRCPVCREPYDWVEEPHDDSPYCSHCMSPGEQEWLRTKREALEKAHGEDAFVQRVSKATGFDAATAREWLRDLGAGQCGWCGGTGRDLSAPAEPPGRKVCPVCLGAKKCIGCGGDSRVAVGRASASNALERYRLHVGSLSVYLPRERAREELFRENELLLRRALGTVEAAEAIYWPLYREGGATPKVAVGVARSRVDDLLDALVND